jgi:hypothetical protein
MIRLGSPGACHNQSGIALYAARTPSTLSQAMILPPSSQIALSHSFVITGVRSRVKVERLRRNQWFSLFMREVAGSTPSGLLLARRIAPGPALTAMLLVPDTTTEPSVCERSRVLDLVMVSAPIDFAARRGLRDRACCLPRCGCTDCTL